MSEEDKLKLVEDFIYNDEVQSILSEINSNVMDFNILEITGMGSQEIKHSNILGWLFDDSEHNLEYQILDGFLKKVIASNIKYNETNKELQAYLYLANKKRDITIYREKDNIDLLIIDEANKIVITIENKVYAKERTDGEDGGQLTKYKKNIDEKYNDSYTKYFIFLTIDLEEPSKENWLRASYQMIIEVIENILQAKETGTKTKIILESYIDLLKRNGIVADGKLKELCEKIWNKKEHEDALDILGEYRVTQIKRIYNRLKQEFNYSKNEYDIELEGIKQLHQKFGLTWGKDKTDKQFFEVQIVYESGKDDSIWLGYFYPELEETEESFQKICEEILPRRNKKHSTCLNINKKDIGDKDIDTVVEEILNKIDKIDKKILDKVGEI